MPLWCPVLSLRLKKTDEDRNAVVVSSFESETEESWRRPQCRCSVQFSGLTTRMLQKTSRCRLNCGHRPRSPHQTWKCSFNTFTCISVIRSIAACDILWIHAVQEQLVSIYSYCRKITQIWRICHFQKILRTSDISMSPLKMSIFSTRRRFSEVICDSIIPYVWWTIMLSTSSVLAMFTTGKFWAIYTYL